MSFRLTAPAFVAFAAGTTPLAALAAPKGNELSREAPSFYLYGSPIFFGVPFGDDDVEDIVDISYQWGFGFGGLFALGSRRNFGLGIGLNFEHNPFTLDDDYDDFCDNFDLDCSAHAFRILPELRLGYLWKQLYVYGLVAPGFAVTYTRFENPGDDDDDADPGFNFGLGAGVQYVVWKGLFVGGEFGFDLGVYSSDGDDDSINDDDYGVYIFDFKALIGYYF